MRRKVGFIGGKFLPFHNGHLYMILDSLKQVDKLYVVLTSSKIRDKQICERDGIKYIPSEIRLSWIGEAVKDIAEIKIVHIEDDQTENDYDWEEGSKRITNAIEDMITHVFSSEVSYDDIFKMYYPGVEHIVIDPERKNVNISATEIRQNIYGNWDKLPVYVRSYFVKRIVIIGTESTGKSTLVTKLAKYYNTNYVHEVGRDYCINYSNQLTTEMFDSIAMEHYLLQEKLSKSSNRILFVDSEAIITEYYLKIYCQKSSKLISAITDLQQFDLWLYLEPDVEWKDDGFRFAGEKQDRIRNNEKLKQMFLEKGIKYISISGNYSTRFLKACKEIEKIME